jgi:hypothetical protein
MAVGKLHGGGNPFKVAADVSLVITHIFLGLVLVFLISKLLCV